MESAAYPLSLTLKEEEEEEEIQSREPEDGPTDMQKVRICSEGGWVSQQVWVHTAVRSRPGSQALLSVLLRQTEEVKIEQPSPVCLHS